MCSQQQHKRWHLKGSTLVKCTGYINSVWLKALLAFTVWVWMYNYETERKDGEEREEGRSRENKRTQKRERRGGEGERVFHVPPEFERPRFHVSIVIFSLFSFHLLHLSPRDKDITLLVQGGQYRRVPERVHSLECLCAWEKCSNLILILALNAYSGVMCMQGTLHCVRSMMPPEFFFFFFIKMSGGFLLNVSTNCSLPKQNVHYIFHWLFLKYLLLPSTAWLTFVVLFVDNLKHLIKVRENSVVYLMLAMQDGIGWPCQCLTKTPVFP